MASLPASESHISETTTLLPSQDVDADSYSNETVSPATRRALIASGLFFAFLVDVSFGLLLVPLVALYERAVCRYLHPNVPDPSRDSICKGSDVQAELAYITGWGLALCLVPSLLVVVPYGALADRCGRRLVLFMGSLGVLVMACFLFGVASMDGYVNPRLSWLAALVVLCGGGVMTMRAMLFTVASDISTPEQRANTFIYVGMASTATEIVSGPLTYWMMQRSAWLGAYTGIAGLALATLMSLLLPETRSPAQIAARRSSPSSASVTTAVKTLTTNARNTFASRNRDAIILVLVLALTMIGRDALILFAQYAAKRFPIGWADVGLLNFAKGAAAMTAFFVLLPSASWLLTSAFGFTAGRKDLWLARFSILCTAAGDFLMGSATTKELFVVSIVVGKLGQGTWLLLRSLLTTSSKADTAGAVNATASLFETAGMLVAGPITAHLFALGIRWGNAWMGLPFLFAGGVTTIGLLMMFGVAVPGSGDVDDEDADGVQQQA